MSIFNEILPKLNEISKVYVNSINEDLKAALQCFQKFEEEYQNGRNRAREKVLKDKNLMTTLQSINEDETEPTKAPEVEKPASSDDARSSSESNGERRGSKKRSKNEVDGIFSPEQDKRQKRNASVKAQSVISKQVNINLNQKLRREDPKDKSKSHRYKDNDKENTEPIHIIKDVSTIKQEKLSIPSEPMDLEPLDVEVKQESKTDEIAMPPPAAPVPKPRKAVQKEKSEDSTDDESSGSRRRTTRTRKQTDTLPAAAPSSRSTRGSSRAARSEAEEVIPDARPKRTRAKKKAESESSNPDTEKESLAPQENGIASPAEKPRPKRTRRAQKAAEKEAQAQQEPQKPTESNEPSKPTEPEKPPKTTQPEKPSKTTQPDKQTKATEPETPAELILLSPKKERLTEPEVLSSPIIQPKKKLNPKSKYVDQSKINLIDETSKTMVQDNTASKTILVQDKAASNTVLVDNTIRNLALEETRIIAKDSNVVNGMDTTVVLPNGVYNHTPVTPKSVNNMNETVVLEKFNRETIVLEKPKNAIMDATVVIDKDPKASARLTDDNSLLTDDSDSHTPPRPPPPAQPTSAVKEKVQQFEELASRVTRTKTRAMAKKQDTKLENQTPPDKISKAALPADTLTKMNSMIFNGKAPQISTSATKPRANIVTQVKSFLPASTSKLSGINRAREAADEQKREKEDARRKKEALLEAKREMQKKKREDKMAAAAAARELAERERRAAMEAAARERMEKQAHADQGKLERLKEAERKKQELARKVAETEERRKAEELARQQRLAEEQRKADAARRKQIEEAEAMKKEEAIMAREIEKRKKEYIEKQKMKQRMDGEKISSPWKTGNYGPMEPVYMEDGFQYLNSDEEHEPEDKPKPAWSMSKNRRVQLCIQAHMDPQVVYRLFSVREHTPDLREIFPNIERAHLKRTSSAVWRTPPRLPPLHE